jgi:hypothetical protein
MHSPFRFALIPQSLKAYVPECRWRRARGYVNGLSIAIIPNETPTPVVCVQQRKDRVC